MLGVTTVTLRPNPRPNDVKTMTLDYVTRSPMTENLGATLPSSSRYRVVRAIASGGMGKIYMGYQRGAGGFARRVAIKRAIATKGSHVREAILNEARIGSIVRHPNVVSIDDVEEIGDELILVMDYIDGGSLSQLIAAGQLPLGVALRIALDACAGLDAIHNAKDLNGRALGLVHRDISPQNILLGLDGVARIADFGIAKGAYDKSQTGPSMRRGKFGYMAPEYIKLRVSTPRSDLFALGVVLWEMLAGRRLFEGASGLESLKLAMAADVPSLRSINPMVTTEIDAFVQRALSKSPHDRFRSMRHFGEELEFIAHGLIARPAEVTRYVAYVLEQRARAAETDEVRAATPSATSARQAIVKKALEGVTPPSGVERVSSAAPPRPETLPSIHITVDEAPSGPIQIEYERPVLELVATGAVTSCDDLPISVETESGERAADSYANEDDDDDVRSSTTNLDVADVELIDPTREPLSTPMGRWHKAMKLEEILNEMGGSYAIHSESASGTIVAAPSSIQPRSARVA